VIWDKAKWKTINFLAAKGPEIEKDDHLRPLQFMPAEPLS